MQAGIASRGYAWLPATDFAIVPGMSGLEVLELYWGEQWPSRIEDLGPYYFDRMAKYSVTERHVLGHPRDVIESLVPQFLAELEEGGSKGAALAQRASASPSPFPEIPGRAAALGDLATSWDALGERLAALIVHNLADIRERPPELGVLVVAPILAVPPRATAKSFEALPTSRQRWYQTFIGMPHGGESSMFVARWAVDLLDDPECAALIQRIEALEAALQGAGWK